MSKSFCIGNSYLIKKKKKKKKKQPPDFFLIICIGQIPETYSSIGHSKKSCNFGPNWRY